MMMVLVIKCGTLDWLTDIEINSLCFQKIGRDFRIFFKTTKLLFLLKYSYFCIFKFPNLWKLDFQSLNSFNFKSIQESKQYIHARERFLKLSSDFFRTIKHFSRNMEQFPYNWNLYRRWSLDIEFPPGNTAISIEMFPLCHGKHEDFQADFGLMNLMFQPAPVSPVVVYNVNMYAAIWEIHFNDTLPTYYHSSGLLHL